jgi:hypothetical protein
MEPARMNKVHYLFYPTCRGKYKPLSLVYFPSCPQLTIDDGKGKPGCAARDAMEIPTQQRRVAAMRFA